MDISIVQILKYMAYMLSIIVISVIMLNIVSYYFSFDGYAELMSTSTVIFITTVLCTLAAKKVNVFPKQNVKR
jgi:hypothetical protein